MLRSRQARSVRAAKGDAAPVAFRLPWRADQAQAGGPGGGAGQRRIGRHLSGEGMGGVDHRGYGVGGKVAGQPVRAAKTAAPGLGRDGGRVGGDACQRGGDGQARGAAQAFG
jgi:hypothetical protein